MAPEIQKIIEDMYPFSKAIDTIERDWLNCDISIEMETATKWAEIVLGFKRWCDQNCAMKDDEDRSKWIVYTFSGLNYNKAYSNEELFFHYLTNVNKPVTT